MKVFLLDFDLEPNLRTNLDSYLNSGRFSAKWGLLREGWAVPLLEGCLESLLMQTLGYLPRAGMQESRVDPEREMARRHGLSARDWQEAIRGVRRHRGLRSRPRPF